MKRLLMLDERPGGKRNRRVRRRGEGYVYTAAVCMDIVAIESNARVVYHPVRVNASFNANAGAALFSAYTHAMLKPRSRVSTISGNMELPHLDPSIGRAESAAWDLADGEEYADFHLWECRGGLSNRLAAAAVIGVRMTYGRRMGPLSLDAFITRMLEETPTCLVERMHGEDPVKWNIRMVPRSRRERLMADYTNEDVQENN